MGIVDGFIPLSVPPGETGPTVTWLDFDGYKAEQKRMVGVIKQLIEGGGYMIGSLMFTTVEDSVSYYHRYFPQESYDCIVGSVGLMGSIMDGAISQVDVKRQNLLGSRTGMTMQQSTIMASFSATYPAVLVSPKAGRDQSKDFSAMKTFVEWNNEDSQHGLSITLTKSMCDEVTALHRHIPF